MKKIKILDRAYLIEGDKKYIKSVGRQFEPSTVKLIHCFCSPVSQVIDIGANIGLTTLALASICSQGKIVAIEPIPETFKFLQNNIKNSAFQNVDLYHFAAGEENGTVRMYGNTDFLAGAFVGDKCSVEMSDHFSKEVPLTKLDDVFSSFNLNQIDFIKMDVEGYELSVLKGAKHLLNEYKPIVMLEMNHWCLNMFQNITLPQFKAQLFQLFPYVFAVDQTIYCDLMDDHEFYETAHAHLTNFKFMNIVAGFDKEKIINALKQNNYIPFKEASLSKRKALNCRFNLTLKNVLRKFF